MSKTVILLCKVYALIILAALSVLLPFPYLLMPLLFLSLMLFAIFRAVPSKFQLVSVSVILVASPLLLELLEQLNQSGSSVQLLYVAMSNIPLIYLLDYYLKLHARESLITAGREGRHITTTGKALFASALVTVALSAFLNKPTLLFTGLILVAYLAGIIIFTFFTIKHKPVVFTKINKRALAGSDVYVPLDIYITARFWMHAIISPVESWSRVAPSRFILDETPTTLNLRFTPPLAGSSRLRFRLSLLDPRGLNQINQSIEPVQLSVIPRARYAEWLAVKYLEQTGKETSPSTTLSPTGMKPRRGVEYLSSRSYQPGDSIRDIDWKRTLKLNQIVIKEYAGSDRPTVIIAVNLSVSNTEEMDRLAFNLITTALTLAQEGVPSGLTAYDDKGVVAVVPVDEPREIVKVALSLVKEVKSGEFAHRYLQFPDIRRLRRNIDMLKRSKSKSGKRLLDLLTFEYRSLEESSRKNPATIALSQLTRAIPFPALVLVLSQLNHDAEAVAVAADKLSKSGFTILPVEEADFIRRLRS